MSAPTGFASSVTAYMRTEVAKDRFGNNHASLERKNRWALLDACAALPASAGDDDARIVALDDITKQLHGSGAYFQPGNGQLAFFTTIGLEPGHVDIPHSPWTAEKILDGFVAAGVRDLVVHHQRQLSRADKADRALGATHEQQLALAREEAAVVRRQMLQLREEKQRADATYADLKQRYDILRRSAGELDVPAPAPVASASIPAGNAGEASPEPKPEQLPKGIRRRGNRLEASFKAAGQTYSKMVDTPQEGKEWIQRTRELAAGRAPDMASLGVRVNLAERADELRAVELGS